jgi:hypothetical protein
MRISRGWVAWALVAGTLYLIIGVSFAPLSIPSVFFWRLAAWMVSAVVYAAHICYEQFRIRSSPHSTALHVAFGAAIGAFGLAAAAIVHSLLTGTGNLRLMRIALLVWPLITGVPAYVVAFVLAAVVARLPRTSSPEIGYMPAIVRFLGYNPLREAQRLVSGLSYAVPP